MGIFDIPPASGPDAEDGARRVRQILSRLVDQTDAGLARIRGLAETHTIGAIQTELGADSAALTAVYNNMKAMLEDASVGRTVPPIT